VLLKVEGISKSFLVNKSFWQLRIEAKGQEQEQNLKAIDNVSFELDRGKVLVIAGESGSGKTTLAKIIMGAIKPDNGAIFFDGQLVSNLTGNLLKHFRSQVHMVYQDPYASLDPRMKVMDIVMEPLNIHEKRTNKQQKIEKVFRALEEVRLEPKGSIAGNFPHELSGGQRQRVALARAIVLKPKLIIADEPVSMLDVSVRAEILELMVNLKERFQLSFVYITHDLSTARYVGDNIIIMYKGQIVEKGPIDNVLLNPVHPYTKALIQAIPDPDNILASNKVKMI
jgi:peptide/nickel transport system ATP-binding protein